MLSNIADMAVSDAVKRRQAAESLLGVADLMAAACMPPMPTEEIDAR
jgi:hypothetical protein